MLKQILVLWAILTAQAGPVAGPRPGQNPGQSPGPSETQCTPCADQGTLPCPKHKRAEIELEANTRYCSHYIGCSTCKGAMRIDCDQCTIGDGQVEARQADLARWRATRQEYFDNVGTECLVSASAHFDLFWDGGKIKIRGGSLSPHGAMHLYIDRLETLYEDFKAATGAKDGDFRTRFLVMVWDRPKHHMNAAQHYFSQPNPNTSVKRMGAIGRYSVYLDPNEVDPDESHGADLYRNMLHNVSHLLLANAWNAIWPSDVGGGWIDAGVAHYFEDRLDRRCTNFCYVEQDTHADYKAGRWRAPVKALARSNKRPSFSEVIGKRTTQLTPEEHALAWSWCEFLIATDPAAFGRLCRGIKAGMETRELLKREFGFTPFSFEEAWAEHAKGYKKG